MAIYHFSAQMISRSKGQSAVAAAAYRSGERLKDERTNERKFYKREVKPETMILAPSHAPEWVQNRNRLWNEVEASETRKNSQVAREINIALPRELSKSEQVELIRGYVQKEFIEQGMIADVAIHRDDQENPHAHVMLTTREISEEGFTVKNRDWNKKELLEQWREQWAEHANKALEREGIQDQISHLSHEARGLEVLPTVHLGHVAHEMEKRGIESDRGNINRDREEYNRVVVDLQTYREEKRALEQEVARQQEQKQQVERFNTPSKHVPVQEVPNISQVEFTLLNIEKKFKQLEEKAKQVKDTDQYIRWKEETIQTAAHHYREIQLSKDQIQQEQQRIDQLNWKNPFKFNENRQMKKQAEQIITRAKERIEHYEKELTPYKEKLGFDTEKEFRVIQHQHQSYYSKNLNILRNERGKIRDERDSLNNARMALKNAVIEKVVSSYPERPEMRYISYETAKKIHKLSEPNQRTFIPIKTIEKNITHCQSEIQRLHDDLKRVDQYRSRLQRAERYLKKYEESHALVEKTDHNSYLKAKVLHSDSTRQKYEQMVILRDQYYKAMKKEGVSGRTHFEQQVNALHQAETQVPRIETNIQSQENRLSLLEGIINGIEQASREWQREQQQLQKPKRRKQQQQGMDR